MLSIGTILCLLAIWAPLLTILKQNGKQTLLSIGEVTTKLESFTIPLRNNKNLEVIQF